MTNGFQPTIDTLKPELPSSDILICKNVPFGRDYSSTILFTSYEEQKAFFAGRAKYSCTAMKPFTLGEAIRVPYPADQLYECNYIYFTSQKSAKHWPAFITNIKRVNNNCADIEYQLDVLQSWMLEWELNECMVLREHVTDDTPGANIQPEPIDFGDYVLNKEMSTGFFNDTGVMATVVSGDSTIDNECQGGIYQPNQLYFFPVEQGTVGAISDFLGNYINKPEQILSLNMYPAKFKNLSSKDGINYLLVDMKNMAYSDIDGYKAHNFKLYTYPYNMLYVTDFEGNAAVWRYEWFKDNIYSAVCACAYAPSAQPVIAPFNYKGYDGKPNWDEKVTMTPFPVCSWTTDTYRAYLAQNSAGIASGLAGGALQVVGGIAAGVVAKKPVAAIAGIASAVSGVSGIGNTLQDKKNHEMQPVQAKGSVAGDTMFSLRSGVKDFHIFQQCIQKEYAQALDSFFDIYGYAINKVKKPDISGRRSWNFIQTENIQITGEIALADIETLNAIFNRGVTFWHGDYVGDYSRKN